MSGHRNNSKSGFVQHHGQWQISMELNIDNWALLRLFLAYLEDSVLGWGRGLLGGAASVLPLINEQIIINIITEIIIIAIIIRKFVINIFIITIDICYLLLLLYK